MKEEKQNSRSTYVQGDTSPYESFLVNYGREKLEKRLVNVTMPHEPPRQSKRKGN